MSKKYKKTCNYYVEHFLTLASTVTGFILISEFASLLSISVGITSSVIGKKLYNHCSN